MLRPSLVALACLAGCTVVPPPEAPPPPPPTGGEAPATCEDRRGASFAAVDAVVAGGAGCAADADCQLVDVSTDCGGRCPAVVGASSVAGVRSAIAQANRDHCAGFTASGCGFATPSCMDPGAPSCREGRCVAGAAPAPTGSCEQRSEAAWASVDAAVSAGAACTSDAECAPVDVGTDCGGRCPEAVGPGGAERVAAAVAEANRTHCAGFTASGCGYSTPRCMAPAPTCVNGACRIRP